MAPPRSHALRLTRLAGQRGGATTRIPRVPVWVTVVALSVVAAAAVAAAVASAISPPPAAVASASQLTAYQSAIAPQLQNAGAMVEGEIKPSIGSLEDGSLTVAAFIKRASSWQARFERARVALAAVVAPPALTDAALDFDRAFAAYRDAARLLGQVPASTTPAGASSGVAPGVSAAKQADALFNQAAAIIQKQRATDGLSPATDLPAAQS
jgi:hypothetical protein